MGVVGVVVVLFFVIFMGLLLRANPSAVTIGKYDQLYQTVSGDGAPIVGDPQTRFTIVEFADFGCPFCLAYQPTVAQLIDRYVRTGRVRLAFETQMFHEHSDIASQAGLCAAKQHKFWEMHDTMYDIQARQGTDGFTVDNLSRSATGLGLDSHALVACIASGETRPILTQARGVYDRLHIVGTPGLMWSDNGSNWQFFMDDNKQPLTQGGVPLEVIARTIETYYAPKS